MANKIKETNIIDEELPPLPDFLYKYRSIKDENLEYVKKTITSAEVYFPSPDGFNDPFDCKPRFCIEGSQTDIQRYLKRTIHHGKALAKRNERRAYVNRLKKKRDRTAVVNEIQDRMSRELSSFGIFCMSEVPDHILMWSHYADCHQGICLGFLPLADLFLMTSLPVRYQQKFPIINIANDTNIERMEKHFFVKSECWSYEREWRTVDHENGPGLKRLNPNALKSIIFGSQVSRENEKEINDACEKRLPRIDIYRAQLSKSEYKIDIIKL